MINLLPPYYKEELRKEERFRLVLIVGMLFTLFFICLSLALLSIRTYVAAEIETQQVLKEFEAKEVENLQREEIRKTNADLSLLLSFWEGEVLPSNIMKRVADALPETVRITSLTYTPSAQTQKAKVAIRGFAARAEDLLEFQSRVEEDSLFTNVQVPFSSLVQETDVDFSLDFEL